MVQQILFHGILAGMLTGIAMGFFFKWIENVTGSKVYILLLNVDFVPFLPQPLPEWLEFILHLIVSVGISALYIMLLLRYPSLRTKALRLGIAAGALAIPTFIPLTLLSTRTPAIDDGVALFWWVVGHLLYGVGLGLYGRLFLHRVTQKIYP
jgi:hypothetical protein